MTNTPIAATEGGLLPCPRCGSKAFVTVDFQVWCEVDRCLRLPPRACRYDAILAWNQRATRTPSSPLGGDVVELACELALAGRTPEQFGGHDGPTIRAFAEALDVLRLLLARVRLDIRCGTLPPEWGGEIVERARSIVEGGK